MAKALKKKYQYQRKRMTWMWFFALPSKNTEQYKNNGPFIHILIYIFKNNNRIGLEFEGYDVMCHSNERDTGEQRENPSTFIMSADAFGECCVFYSTTDKIKIDLLTIYRGKSISVDWPESKIKYGVCVRLKSSMTMSMNSSSIKSNWMAKIDDIFVPNNHIHAFDMIFVNSVSEKRIVALDNNTIFVYQTICRALRI